MAINSLSASSHGISGLASGINTQDMVEAALMGTKNKIVRNQQKKAQLQFKQDIYRGLGSSIKMFQGSFFSFASKEGVNLMADSFFNSMSASGSSRFAKITATSNASTGSHKLSNVKMATTTTLKGSEKRTGALKGEFDESRVAALRDKMKGSVSVIQNGVTKEIDITDLAGLGADEFSTQLSAKMQAAGLNVQTSYENGKLSFRSTDSKEFQIQASGSAAAALGVGESAKMDSINGARSIVINVNKLMPSIDVTLDGEKKTVYFKLPDATLTGDALGQKLADNIQEGIRKVHGGTSTDGVQVKYDSNDNTFSFSIAGSNASTTKTRSLTLSGGIEAMSVLGIRSGSSNKMSTGMKLSQISFAEPLAGGMHRFSINGTDFNISSDRTLSSVVNEINNSSAGVKIEYNELTDSFSMKATAMGEGGQIKLEQKSGNLLNVLMGEDAVDGSGEFSSSGLTRNTAVISDYVGFDFKQGSLSFQIVKKGETTQKTIGIQIPEKADSSKYTPEELVTAINQKIAEAAKEDDELKAAGVSFSMDSLTREVKFTTSGNYDAILGSVDADSTLDKLGFIAGQSTKAVDGNTRLNTMGYRDPFTITFGNQTVTVNPTDSLDDMNAAMNAALSTVAPGAQVELDNNMVPPRFKFFGVGIPMGIKVSGDGGKLFGHEDEFTVGTVADPAEQAGQMTSGTNATFELDGVLMERNSNNFTINGLQIELVDNTRPDEEFTTAVTRDSTKVVEGITKFVEEYNKIVNSMSTLLQEDPNYRDYPPLTDEQKASMSDREVEMWEERAKEGLMRGDSTINKVLADMRKQLYQKSNNSTLALYDLGIETTASGEITLDLTRLNKALSESPDEVRKLFTSADGVGTNLNAAMNRAASTSTGSPGYFTQVAGASGMTDTKSSLYKQMKEIDTNLDSLEDLYESEYNRYWKQYTAMEKMIQNMNSQSAWLSQQFSA